MKLLISALVLMTATPLFAQTMPGTADRTIVSCHSRLTPDSGFTAQITVPGLNPIYSATAIRVTRFGRNVLFNNSRVSRTDNAAKQYVEFWNRNFSLIVRTTKMSGQGYYGGKLTAVANDGSKVNENALACEWQSR